MPVDPLECTRSGPSGARAVLLHIAILAGLVLMLLAIGMATCAASGPPRAALEYRADLTREARAAWGMQAPVAVMAAQIHQESAWRPDAQSPYADGLAQFVPATAEWVAERWPALGGAAPFNPQWAIRAMVRYDQHLKERYGQPAATECDSWAFTLSAYNGGQGNLLKDQRLCRADAVQGACDRAATAGLGSAGLRAEPLATITGRPLPLMPAYFAGDGYARLSWFSRGLGHLSALFGIAPAFAKVGGDLRSRTLVENRRAVPLPCLSQRLASLWRMRSPEEMIVCAETAMLGAVLAMRHDGEVVRHEVGPVFVDVVDEKRAGQFVPLDALGDEPVDVSNATIDVSTRVAIQQEYLLTGLQSAANEYGSLRQREFIDAHDSSLSRCVCACDPDRWFGHVERHTHRADWAREENRSYVTRILLVLQSRYASWGGGVSCPAR